MKMAKRLFDLVISSALLLILSPVILLTSLVVILDTGFPVFYRGLRVGREGRSFYIFKFRSMVADSRQKGLGITADSDCRITGSGRFLRKWKLDEFPQFFNVLRGEMSLVGPRPEDPRYVEHYTAEERRIISIKPGVTGASQILFRNEEELLNVDDPEGYYIDCIMREKLRVDLAYAEQQSFFFDLLIIAYTVLVVLFPGKSAGICQKLLERLHEDSNISCPYQIISK
jgi:lipopolysaccharide/colanic/teichoic acid biosynthesis glycosyltransferase